MHPLMGHVGSWIIPHAPSSVRCWLGEGWSLSPRCGPSARGSRGDTVPAARPEIPVEQVSGGVLARMRPDLSLGSALTSPGDNLWGGGSPGAWHARVAWTTMQGWLVMTAGPKCGETKTPWPAAAAT